MPRETASRVQHIPPGAEPRSHAVHHAHKIERPRLGRQAADTVVSRCVDSENCTESIRHVYQEVSSVSVHPTRGPPPPASPDRSGPMFCKFWRSSRANCACDRHAVGVPRALSKSWVAVSECPRARTQPTAIVTSARNRAAAGACHALPHTGNHSRAPLDLPRSHRPHSALSGASPCHRLETPEVESGDPQSPLR